MLRVAAFAGGGLEFLGTLSARLFVLCAWRTVVPVNQGCTGWVMLTCNVTYSWWFAFPLTRRWCVCYSRRSKDAGPEIVKRGPRVRCKPQSLWGVSIGDGEYGAPTIPAPPWVPGAHKTFIGGSRVLSSVQQGPHLSHKKVLKTSSLNGERPPQRLRGGRSLRR